ncbi:hypothetical protein PanWU01x14_262440 [Parasponia andersonii]|uniref:Uncharacterized protein n=1 Tax=Parasponia andersonii TaxID=3476 RepID=A0A2P5B875_PARAD|nr:hypothetical protein PanWU01x14_262440 [Parasponia andersonii]
MEVDNETKKEADVANQAAKEAGIFYKATDKDEKEPITNSPNPQKINLELKANIAELKANM